MRRRAQWLLLQVGVLFLAAACGMPSLENVSSTDAEVTSDGIYSELASLGGFNAYGLQEAGWPDVNPDAQVIVCRGTTRQEAIDYVREGVLFPADPARTDGTGDHFCRLGSPPNDTSI